MADKPSKLKIADREFASRLLVGTGKFASNELMRDALIASGTELVTVALRRVDLSGKHDPFANILDFVDHKRFLLLPNTSGARNAEEAVRLARLAASAGLPTWIKLEIHPDPRYLLPDPVETLAAAEILVKEGFTILPYINADPEEHRQADQRKENRGLLAPPVQIAREWRRNGPAIQWFRHRPKACRSAVVTSDCRIFILSSAISASFHGRLRCPTAHCLWCFGQKNRTCRNFR